MDGIKSYCERLEKEVPVVTSSVGGKDFFDRVCCSLYHHGSCLDKVSSEGSRCDVVDRLETEIERSNLFKNRYEP